MLLIDRAQSDEGFKDTKTGGIRSVRLLAPLVADLAAWRLVSGPLIGEALVFHDLRHAFCSLHPSAVMQQPASRSHHDDHVPEHVDSHPSVCAEE
jgi:hypothetical protein